MSTETTEPKSVTIYDRRCEKIECATQAEADALLKRRDVAARPLYFAEDPSAVLLEEYASERVAIIVQRATQRAHELIERRELIVPVGKTAEQVAAEFAPAEIARKKAEFAASHDPRKRAIAAKLPDGPRVVRARAVQPSGTESGE